MSTFPLRQAPGAIVFLFGACLLYGQDSRTVTEPTIPDEASICSIQTAQLASVNGDLSPDDESHFDAEGYRPR